MCWPPKTPTPVAQDTARRKNKRALDVLFLGETKNSAKAQYLHDKSTEQKES